MCLNLKCGELCAFDIEPVEILEQSYCICCVKRQWDTKMTQMARQFLGNCYFLNSSSWYLLLVRDVFVFCKAKADVL